METIKFKNKPVKATFTGDLYHDGGLMYENDKYIYSVFDGVAVVRQSKNTHGGSRGGGRPKKSEEEKKGKNVTFRPSPEVAAILPDGDGNRTIFIEKSLLMRSMMAEILTKIGGSLPKTAQWTHLAGLLNSFNDSLSDEEILQGLRKLL